MTVGANSYGTSAGVAALTPRYAGTGDFTTGTRPTLAQVEGWVDQVSAMVNAMLAQAGFTIPVSQADCVLLLKNFVQQEVATLVEGVNGSGRFGPTVKPTGGRQGRYALLLEDVQAFVEINQTGLERLGAVHSAPASSGIGFRDTDEAGADTFPIFQRDGFGNVFDNWGG